MLKFRNLSETQTLMPVKTDPLKSIIFEKKIIDLRFIADVCPCETYLLLIKNVGIFISYLCKNCIFLMKNVYVFNSL